MRTLPPGLTLIACLLAGLHACASPRPEPEYPEFVETPPPTPTPAQAKARADAWAREDAEAERQTVVQAKQRTERDAAKAALDEQRRAELAANPFAFQGDFHAGRDSCPTTRSFKFHDIKSLGRDCEQCRCEYAAKRSQQGTTWSADCTGGKPGTLKRKLFVSNRHTDAPAAGTTSWHATFEEMLQRSGVAITCGYVGWMTDRAGQWKQAETEQEQVGPEYDLPAR
jgi:hypothetical protein